MTVKQFAREHQTNTSLLHPMNVLDIGLSQTTLENKLPEVMTKKLSFGHILMENSKLYERIVPKTKSQVDLVTKVSKFALLSEAGCQTNFHQDFSATCVMYILLHGRKVFFAVRPTTKNCNLLNKWDQSDNKEYTFFGDENLEEGCVPFILNPGDVLFLPSNWIHAVLTHVDSVAIGTNFIFRQFMPQAIEAYQMERLDKYLWDKCFPNFYVLLVVYLHWCFDRQETPVYKNALSALETTISQEEIIIIIGILSISSSKWETIRTWILLLQ